MSHQQDCIPVGCVLLLVDHIPACTPQGWGVSAQGVSAWGCLHWQCQHWGVCPWGCLPMGCLSRGDICPGGVADPVNRMTDRCKNINLPQLHCRQSKMRRYLSYSICVTNSKWGSCNVCGYPTHSFHWFSCEIILLYFHICE